MPNAANSTVFYFLTIKSKAMKTNLKISNDPGIGGGCCGGIGCC